MAMSARITAFTHRGRVRPGNEDTIAVGDWLSPPEMAAPREFHHALSTPLVCAVADGMGGHQAGEVASRYTAEWLAEARERLTDARRATATLQTINAGLYRAMAEDEDLRGMGTTLVGLVLRPRLIWFNVGDSRLYCYRNGRLAQMSIDDTPAGPRSGLLTQTLGGVPLPFASNIEPHVGEDDLTAPVRFLLCSDGLTDMIEDAQIAECLKLPHAAAVAQLFDLAMHAGGMDNVSIVLVSVEGERASDPSS